MMGRSRGMVDFCTKILDDITLKIKTIQEQLKEAQGYWVLSREKYYNARNKAVEFGVGDHAFINVSPIKGITSF